MDNLDATLRTIVDSFSSRHRHYFTFRFASYTCPISLTVMTVNQIGSARPKRTSIQLYQAAAMSAAELTALRPSGF